MGKESTEAWFPVSVPTMDGGTVWRVTWRGAAGVARAAWYVVSHLGGGSGDETHSIGLEPPGRPKCLRGREMLMMRPTRGPLVGAHLRS